MTAYHGGKQRVGKVLSSVIVDLGIHEAEKRGIDIVGYCEPFCGMCGVYRYVPDLFQKKGFDLEYKAGDINKSVIEMWKESQRGWIPPVTTTREEFYTLKKQLTPSAMKGFIGHQFSFSGQYFDTFMEILAEKNRPSASKRVVDIAKSLDTVNFSAGEYNHFSDLKGFIIYCDPPYEGGRCAYRDENYKSLKMDYDRFWEWVKMMGENNIVFVSGYKNRECCKMVWESRVRPRKSGKVNTGRERLYMIKD